MRDLLVRYLLGELDGPEQQQLEEQLARSPELRRELAYLQACFCAAEDYDQDTAGPPRGLAERTTKRVASCGDEPAEAAGQLVPCGAGRVAAFAPEVDPPTGALGWSFADFTVAAGVCLALSMLVVPALRDSQAATRRRGCQNNLQSYAVVHAVRAERHDRFYVPVGPEENAGIYVVRLLDEGVATNDELVRIQICPGAAAGGILTAGKFLFQIPMFPQLQVMSPEELNDARKKMSPSYAYVFGYFKGGKYQNRRDERNPMAPVMSDSPGLDADGDWSRNHPGGIILVLFQDGSVRPLRACTVPGNDDHLFKNDRGLPAAGWRQDDFVLGPSEAVPGTPPVVTPVVAKPGR